MLTMLMGRGLMGRGLCACCAYALAPPASRFAFRCEEAAVAAPAPAHRARAARLSRFAPARRLWLDGGTVVDPRDGSLHPDVSVRVEGDRIVEVAPGARRPSPAPDRIDASGRFIVPGYNDMHSHALELADPSGSLALMLAEGVTGFRQMSGSPELLAARRADRLGLGEAAPALLEAPGTILTPLNAGSARAAAEEVRSQKAQGADFVKMVFADPDVFFAAVAEARRVGVPILGHLQEGVDAAAASRAGFRTIEHLGAGSAIWVGCSTAETELRAESPARSRVGLPFRLPRFVQRLLLGRMRRFLINPAAFAKPADVARLARALDTFDEAKADALAAGFAADGSWQVPTLVRLRSQELAEAPEYERDPSLAYMPPENVAAWRAVTGRFRRLPEAMRATYRAAYPRQRALTKRLAEAGVRMMTGTDGGTLWAPGLTLRQEFEELAIAGLSPLSILRMTTTNAAEYLGRTDRMGTVEAGRAADLVVLEANPLEDVRNLHRIAGVVRAGVHWSAADLAALKARVAAGRGVLH